MRLTPKVSLDPALSSAEALQPVTTQLRSWSLERKTASCDFFGETPDGVRVEVKEKIVLPRHFCKRRDL